jgi:hypothetical protein
MNQPWKCPDCGSWQAAWVAQHTCSPENKGFCIKREPALKLSGEKKEDAFRLPGRYP